MLGMCDAQDSIPSREKGKFKKQNEERRKGRREGETETERQRYIQKGVKLKTKGHSLVISSCQVSDIRDKMSLAHIHGKVLDCRDTKHTHDDLSCL